MIGSLSIHFGGASGGWSPPYRDAISRLFIT